MSRSFEEHTGEVRLRLSADSLAGVFEEAALALADLMRVDPCEASGEPVRVTVRARDRAALLAAWVDELVFLSETHKRIWTEVRVERVSDAEVVAGVRGFAPVALRTQVKAATFHDLRIDSTASGTLEATLVLDV